MNSKQVIPSGHQQSEHSLRNPPGTVWHHPGNKTDVLHLLRFEEHTHPLLQPVLHPNGVGGYRKNYVP
jgi:hypothetical protein